MSILVTAQTQLLTPQSATLFTIITYFLSKLRVDAVCHCAASPARADASKGGVLDLLPDRLDDDVEHDGLLPGRSVALPQL